MTPFAPLGFTALGIIVTAVGFYSDARERRAGGFSREDGAIALCLSLAVAFVSWTTWGLTMLLS